MMNQRDILFDAIGALKRETVPALPKGLVELTVRSVNLELSQTAGIKEGRAVSFDFRKIASVAAVILVVASLAMVTMVTVQRKGTKLPSTKIVTGDQSDKHQEQQLEKVKAMFARGDVDTIIKIALNGDYNMQKAIANYLVEIGGSKAKSLLSQLAVLWDGTDQDNPFTEAIEQIAPTGEAAPNAMEDNVGVDASQPAEDQGVIFFTVMERDMRSPIAGANVNIRIYGTAGTKDQTTDVNGLSKIAIGEKIPKYLNIIVTSPGFVSKSVTYDNYETVKPIPSEYTLLLERGTSIGGVVKNEQGLPIKDAAVLVSVKSNTNDQAQIEKICIHDHKVVTDANGFWQCDIIPKDAEQVDIRLKHPDYVDDDYAGQTVKDPIEVLRQFKSVAVMKKGIVVTGIVTDNQGSAIEGVKFNLGDSKYTNSPVFKSDANGLFSFGHCRQGQLIVTAQAKGYGPQIRQITLGTQTQQLLFQLEPGKTIRGIVVDSQEKPIKGAIVSSESWRGCHTLDYRKSTDADGRFEWTDAPDDEVLFEIYKRGYMSIGKMPMSPDVDDHIIVMYPPIKVSGTVVDASTGEPIDSFDLIKGYQWQNSDNITWQPQSSKRFSQGQYQVEFSQGGVDGFAIRIKADGYLPADSNLFWLDQADNQYNFQLQKGQSPAGVICFADGTPVEGAEVIICNDSSRPYIKNGRNIQKDISIYTKTDANGRFVLPGQNDKFGLLVLDDAGYAIVKTGQFVQDDNIYLKAWGGLEGSLYIGGKAAAGEQVAVSYDNYDDQPRINFEDRAVTDANGQFVFYRLCAGDPKVSRLIQTGPHTTGYSNSESVKIISGQTSYVEIGGQGRAVIGSVVMPENYALPVNWQNADCSISSIIDSDAAVPYPDNIEQMTLKERLQWMVDWQKTQAGIQYAKDNCMPSYPDNLVEMTDQQIQQWLRQWQQSDGGKACMELRRQRQIELEKQRRHYSLNINADGTFKVEDVVPGKYQLRVVLREKSINEFYFSNGEIIATVNNEFMVGDMNSDYSDIPLDIGRLTLEVKNRLMPGDDAADIQLEKLDGTKTNISSFQGKILLLVFCQCGQSYYENILDRYNQIYRTFRSNDEFAAMYISCSDQAKSTKYASDNGLTDVAYLADYNARRTITEDYGISQWPSILLIDKDFKVLLRNPDPATLQSKIDDLVGN